MKIAVCVKQVPSSEARVQLAADGKSVALADAEMVVNPYDEFAVEEALRIKEARGGGEVIVVSVGPESAQAEVRKCLAMGADRGIVVQDPALLGGDGLSTARILAAVLAELQPDLVLCGKLTIDVESDLVAVGLAELLGLPHAALVTHIEWTGERTLRARREIEGGREVVELGLPALISVEKGINEPRYASLKGIMAAKRKPIEVARPDLPAERVGPGAAGVRVVAVAPPPERTGGRKFAGEAEVIVSQVVELLRSEAKVL
ncbi:MAG: electron transfer flavoprotein subunit beta/FixA family protein [Candidatus Eisenbacteria bacterium]|uniref:Electron transfer flavoprotein subunit beta n=1 Tax=Eiseniibacteriota bacterium TaxID=2212470 RepID=A0A937X937_UNCEI|nr:electron transfer flavoprotein subunit beta/FixA family protein [Candidatus Eisenbacteria bacterium]